MDRIYRRQRHFYDVTRKYYLLGRDRLIEGLAPPADGRVLEIGCGTARNLVAAARRWPTARLYGIDISREMLATARQVVERSGLAHRIALAHGDATRFDPALLFAVPSFSRVFFSYSLSMIPGWQDALVEAISWLAPDGELHVVDFSGQQRLPVLVRAGLRHWLARFHVSPRDALAAELDLLSGRAGTLVSFERPYRDYAQYAVFRRVVQRVTVASETHDVAEQDRHIGEATRHSAVGRLELAHRLVGQDGAQEALAASISRSWPSCFSRRIRV